MKTDSVHFSQRISFKLSLVYIVFTALMLFLLMIALSISVRRAFTVFEESRISSDAKRCISSAPAGSEKELSSYLQNFAGAADLHIKARQKQSGTTMTTAKFPLGTERLAALSKKRKDDDGHFFVMTDQISGKNFFYRYDIENAVFEISLYRSADSVNETLNRIEGYILVSVLLAALISSIIIIFISVKITAPLHSLISFAKSLAAGNFSHRFPVDYQNELSDMQKSLNILADKIGQQIYSADIEKNKFIIAFENLSDAAAYLDTDGTILLSNSSFKKIFRLKENLQSLYFDSIRNTEINSKISAALSLRNKTEFAAEISEHTYDVLINTVFTDNRFNGLIITLHDITEKKKIDKIKTELVGNLSHELKTPITIIKGFLETIKTMPDENTARKNFLDKALTNIDRQNSIISDMLKLNRLETTSDFERETMTLNSVISPIVDILTPKIQAAKLNLEYRDEDFSHIKVRCNRFLSEQLFFNLIDNAINYNQENGSISVKVKIADGRTTVSVKDTGVGIPSSSIDRIFERFYRVDKARSRSTGGTGLGLSITKHAADILGWKLLVESREGSGTEFRVEIQ